MHAQAGTIRVLHVDDEPGFAETAAEFLERADDRIEVLTASDADDGCERLAAEPVDCVVSDYDMPERNGIRFLERVRTDHPDLPFILFTGKGSEEVASRAISAGVTDYLQKESGTDQYEILANRIANAVERYRAERAAERRERQLRTTLDNIPFPAFVVDEELTYRVSNEAHARFHGMDPTEVEGTNAAQLLDEADFEDFRARCSTVAEESAPMDVPETELPDADGETRVLRPRLIPLEPVDDAEWTVLGVSVDVTDYKRRERESRRYEAMLDAVRDSACIYDAEGRFRTVNDYLVDFYDTSREDLIGRKSRLVEHVRESEPDCDPFEELVAGDRDQFRGVYEGDIRGEGRETVDYRLTRLTVDGEFEGVVAIGRTVSD